MISGARKFTGKFQNYFLDFRKYLIQKVSKILFSENTAALGGDINGILITNENQKIDDLVPTIANLVAIAITTGQDAAAMKSAHPKVRVFKVGNVDEATTALVNAIDGVAEIAGEI